MGMLQYWNIAGILLIFLEKIISILQSFSPSLENLYSFYSLTLCKKNIIYTHENDLA